MAAGDSAIPPRTVGRDAVLCGTGTKARRSPTPPTSLRRRCSAATSSSARTGGCVGAVIAAEGGPVEIGAHCVVMENAVVRGVPSTPRGSAARPRRPARVAHRVRGRRGHPHRHRRGGVQRGGPRGRGPARVPRGRLRQHGGARGGRGADGLVRGRRPGRARAALGPGAHPGADGRARLRGHRVRVVGGNEVVPDIAHRYSRSLALRRRDQVLPPGQHVRLDDGRPAEPPPG